MKVDERALQDVHTVGGGETPPRVGLTSNTLPKAQSTVSAESSQTGVSTRNARSETMFQPQKQGGNSTLVCLTLYIRQREESLQLHGSKRHYGILPYHRSS